MMHLSMMSKVIFIMKMSLVFVHVKAWLGIQQFQVPQLIYQLGHFLLWCKWAIFPLCVKCVIFETKDLFTSTKNIYFFNDVFSLMFVETCIFYSYTLKIKWHWLSALCLIKAVRSDCKQFFFRPEKT
jgi:hypothetical protein